MSLNGWYDRAVQERPALTLSAVDLQGEESWVCHISSVWRQGGQSEENKEWPCGSVADSRGGLRFGVSALIFPPVGVRGARWAFHLGVIMRGVESRWWRREGLSPPSRVPTGGLEPGREYKAANLLPHTHTQTHTTTTTTTHSTAGNSFFIIKKRTTTTTTKTGLESPYLPRGPLANLQMW